LNVVKLFVLLHLSSPRGIIDLISDSSHLIIFEPLQEICNRISLPIGVMVIDRPFWAVAGIV